MKPIRAPFGVLSHGPSASWPEFTGPSIEPRRRARRPELWERHPDHDAFAGELALADLPHVTDRDEALLVLARYLTVRVARFAGPGGPQDPQGTLDRDAALQYLEAMDNDDQEARWLRAVLTSIERTGVPTCNTIARMNAAANASSRRGHVHGAHALHSTAWAIATGKHWHAEAARIAASIASAAGRAGGHRSQRLWARRARVMRARAAG